MFEKITEHMEEIEKTTVISTGPQSPPWVMEKSLLQTRKKKRNRRLTSQTAKQDNEYQKDENRLDTGEHNKKESSLIEDKVALSKLSLEINFNEVITEEVSNGNFLNLPLLTDLNDKVLNALVLSGPNNRKHQETIDNTLSAKNNGKQGELEIFEQMLITQKEQGFYLEDGILDLRSVSKLNHRQADKLSMVLNIKEIRLDGLEILTPELAVSLTYFNVEKINLSGIDLDTVDNEIAQKILESKNSGLQLVFSNGKDINSKNLYTVASIN